MNKATLVVMAAGAGSRYGGLKQIDPVGPSGEIIMDYSIYDAIAAGFDKVVFIIKKEIEAVFHEVIGQRFEGRIATAYAYQEVDKLPAGRSVPEGRTKPWGTAHAVLCARDVIDSPFAVINADDFYGASSYRLLADELKGMQLDAAVQPYCMVGFQLENTLTENGHVARGICTANAEGYLSTITERTRIERFEDGAKYTEDGEHWTLIPERSIVSMNTWGFTPAFLDELEARFPTFLDASRDNILKAEYFLPSVVDATIREGKARVHVLPSQERWYGVTYQQDKPVVKQAIADMIAAGRYPEKLWGGK